ncbi:hypothetical protein [Actinomadura gamaensis]|uniref:Uncharacterized protein n=1 Tax=Actinomadura gamaensis TaxID=1763541 RepID=A0ABV9U1U3_9ACTN
METAVVGHGAAVGVHLGGQVLQHDLTEAQLLRPRLGVGVEVGLGGHLGVAGLAVGSAGTDPARISAGPASARTSWPGSPSLHWSSG